MQELIAAHNAMQSTIQMYGLALQRMALRIEELEKENQRLLEVVEMLRPKE